MPPLQRGQAYKIGPGKWGLRYYDRDGVRRRKSPFPTRSAALTHFRDVIEPVLLGEPAALPDLTFAEFTPLYLERHAATVRTRTIDTLRERLSHSCSKPEKPCRCVICKPTSGKTCRCATCAFGSVRLRELERMSGELASWQAQLPERSRYGVVQALRQTLEAAVRWGYMNRNPAKLAGRNPQPSPRTVRAFTRAEVDAIGHELSTMYASLPQFAAATGLRPEEWQALERRDVDRRAGVLTVARTVSDGEVVELGKTGGSRRQVPLSRRAIEALDALPPRIDTPLLYPAPAGGLMNLDNFRRREWAPAIEAAAIPAPARIYDLRSTFASNALAANLSVFRLARVMGTSVRMIERHYGALLDGGQADIASHLDAFEAEQDRADDAAEDV